MKAENEVKSIATQQDIKLVRLLADGYQGREIAKKMDINNNTLAFNLSVLRRQFGCKNSIHLVAHFFRQGLID